MIAVLENSCVHSPFKFNLTRWNIFVRAETCYDALPDSHQKSFTRMDIAHWLAEIGLSQYLDCFEHYGIDAAALGRLDHEKLQEIGVHSVRDRQRLLQAIRDLDQSAIGRLTATAPQSSRSERKLVTIMFASIVNSSELVEALDPEDLMDRLAIALDAMRQAVSRYGGTVNRHMGDGIMALFGAPVALEDHAPMAATAGLAIVEAVRKVDPALSVCIGLHSGDVLVRLVRNDVTTDYDAAGVPVHIAARIEQMAEPDCVLVSAATLALAEGYLETETLGEYHLRGINEPVIVHRLINIRKIDSRFGLRALTGLTPFVGRETEMTMLRNRLQDAAQGRPQITALSGEPGVGKSRLVHEFTETAAQQEWRVIRAAGEPQSQNQAYGPIRVLLQRLLKLEQMPGETAVAALAESLAEISPVLAETQAPLSALLDLPIAQMDWQTLDPAMQRKRILDSIQALVAMLAQQAPLLLVIEDLHWIDSESLAALQAIAQIPEPARLFLVLNYRTEFQVPWHPTERLAILPIQDLPTSAAETMITALIGNDASLTQARKILAARTNGRPLFVEEAIKTAADSGVLTGSSGAYRLASGDIDIDIPASIQVVLAARIDALPDAAKELLQVASVLGENFADAILAQIDHSPAAEREENLKHLVNAELLRQSAIFPEAAYTFKHALLHDVSYESMPLERRRELHNRVLDALEARFPEQTDALAHHAYHAERWLKAVQYLREAADKARFRCAYREAIRLYSMALHALRNSGARHTGDIDVELQLRTGLDQSLVSQGDYERLLIEAKKIEALAEKHERWSALFRCRTELTFVLTHLGRTDEAIAMSELAAQVGAQANIRNWPFWAATTRAELNRYLGHYQENVELLSPHVDLATGHYRHTRAGIATGSCYMLGSLLVTYFELGELQKVNAVSALLQEILAELPERYYDHVSFSWRQARILQFTGAREQAFTLAEAAFQTCQAHQIWFQHAWIESQFAVSNALIGHHDKALKHAKAAVTFADDIGLKTQMTRTRSGLGFVQILGGQFEDARETIASAIELTKSYHYRSEQAYAHYFLAQAEAGCGDWAAAEVQNHAAIDLAEGLNMRPLNAKAQKLGGIIASQRTAPDQAQAHFGKAADLFQKLGLADMQRNCLTMADTLDGNTLTLDQFDLLSL